MTHEEELLYIFFGHLQLQDSLQQLFNHMGIIKVVKTRPADRIGNQTLIRLACKTVLPANRKKTFKPGLNR
jgi:hypothetical protein